MAAELTIAGAGMAGLCAAARARELGARPVLLEKGDRPGGSMLLSTCVVWRYRTLDDFRRECPGGEPALQAAVIDRLDDDLAWLEALGAPVVARETGNPRTVGLRFDPRGLTDALVRAAGEPRLRSALGAWVASSRVDRSFQWERHRKRSLGDAGGAVVLATGGFQGDGELVRSHITPEADRLWLRANRWSGGDGLRYGLARGAALSRGLDEFYGRNMPAPPARVDEHSFVELAQLYGRWALVVDDAGRVFGPDPPTWSEIELVQATARLPGARAWYVVDGRALRERVRERSVAEMVDAAEAAGGEVRRADDLDGLGLPLPRSPKLREPPFAAVRVAPGITHTIGGLRVDARARVLDARDEPIDALYAAGADAGGISTGGYASGLAAALVFGRLAAEAALT